MCYLLFNITTDIIVTQKNIPDQPELSVIAKITVKTNIKTNTKMLHTMRVVKLPLKSQKHISLINHIIIIIK